MVIDVILGLIVLISMFAGYRRGFFSTFIHIFGWLIAVAGAWYAKPYVVDFIRDNTSLQGRLQERIASIITPDPEAAMSFFPEIFKDNIESAIGTAAGQIAESAFSVLCFIVLVLAVKIILVMIARIFERENDDSVIGFFNSTLGMCLGLLRGAIIVVIITAFLFPLLSTMSQDIAQVISDNLDSSRFAKIIYDNNPITQYINRG